MGREYRRKMGTVSRAIWLAWDEEQNKEDKEQE